MKIILVLILSLSSFVLMAQSPVNEDLTFRCLSHLNQNTVLAEKTIKINVEDIKIGITRYSIDDLKF